MKSGRRFNSARCAAVAVSLVLGTGAFAQKNPPQPPQGTFEDLWYVLLLNGERSGHMHATRTRTADTVESVQQMTLKMKRAGAELSISMKRTDLETIAGKPLGFTSQQEFGGATVTKTGTIKDGRLTLVLAQGGASTTNEYPWDSKARLSWAAYLEQMEHALRPGAKYTFHGYDPDLSPAEALVTTHEVIGQEEVRLLEGSAKAWRVNSSTKAGGAEITAEDWLDEKGVSLRSKINMLGIGFEVVRCTKEQAGEETKGAEVFVSSLVEVDRAIKPDAKRVVLRITTPADTKLDLPQTAMQTVKSLGKGTYEVTITRLDRERLENAAATRDSDEARAHLKPTVYANSDDPQIRKMAGSVLSGAEGTSGYGVADKLRQFASKEITSKSLNVAFATAGDVAKTREGDCTEHAVFLAALARAARIPSRGVIGLVYVPEFAGRRNIFGFHMWTQVLLGGQWVDLDAALNQTDVDPTHFALAVSDLGDEAIGGAAGLQMIQLIGKLQIDVVSVE